MAINRFFWRHVTKSGPFPHPDTGIESRCWLWTGARCGTNAEYGQTRSDGRKRMAHAVAYEDHFGIVLPRDRKQVIDHRCRVTLCVNPEHLEHTTQRENLARGFHRPLTTHCPKGHPKSGDNLGVTKYGTRFCRTCMREHYRTWEARASAAGTLRKPVWRNGKYQGRETSPGSGIGVREA